MPTKTIAIRLPEDLLEYLTKRAEKEHRNLSNMIISLLLNVKEKGDNMIQIDVPMPLTCTDCPCCYDGQDCTAVVGAKHFNDEEREQIMERRMDWCPLKEVKE